MCRFSIAFTYGFHLLPTNLQEVSFYSMKGGLLKGETSCIAGQKDTACNCNRRRGTPNNSANACLLLFHGFCTLCNPFFNAFDYPVCFYLHVFITVKDAEHISAVAEPVVVPDES